MSVTLELSEADEALLKERARAEGVTEAEYLLRLLRGVASEAQSRRFDFPTIDTGGFTEAALKLDMRKSRWWEELEDEEDAA